MRCRCGLGLRTFRRLASVTEERNQQLHKVPIGTTPLPSVLSVHITSTIIEAVLHETDVKTECSGACPRVCTVGQMDAT
jgi:hypothetical protein